MAPFGIKIRYRYRRYRYCSVPFAIFKQLSCDLKFPVMQRKGLVLDLEWIRHRILGWIRIRTKRIGILNTDIFCCININFVVP